MKLLVAGVVCLILASAIVVVVVDPLGSGDSHDVAAVVSSTKTPRPSVTFYPTPTETPLVCNGVCPILDASGTRVIINGTVIPRPKGAQIYPPIPDSYGVGMVRGDSKIWFFTNGWLETAEIAPADVDDFAPTLDALAAAATTLPVGRGGTEVRLPRGMTYRPSLLVGGPPHDAAYVASWAGLPELAPQYQVFRLRDSILTVDVRNDSIGTQSIQPEDVEDFQPILEALLNPDGD